MKEETAKMVPNPLIASLPNYLKDPANFYKIQKALLEAGSTPHSHGSVGEWGKCLRCQRAQWNRKEMMIKLGFKSGAQYMAWKLVHSEIKKRMPLIERKKHE